MAIGRTGKTGRLSLNSSSATQLTADTRAVTDGVQLLASSANSGTVYVGYDNTITANSGDATDGFPLAAGAGIFLPCRHASDIWAIGVSGNKVWFLGQ